MHEYDYKKRVFLLALSGFYPAPTCEYPYSKLQYVYMAIIEGPIYSQKASSKGLHKAS
jgi:hypothetical protein